MQDKDESSPDTADTGDLKDNVDADSTDPQAESPVVDKTVSDDEPSPEEELPEWEPLTPELVEDEAIRGDFMLRWAAILLALLMGWTIIQDTSVLTHVKSGQYLASHGFLPPATDVLSSSAGDRRWVNLSWMWDLATAGAYGMAGAQGVSILKALLAAITFWVLSRISMPDLATWWGSVCSVLALLAAFPSLTATPAIMTLLGTACLMWLLHRWLTTPKAFSPWSIVVLMWVWCQFDDRAWIGAILLIGFTIGQWIDCRRSQEASSPGEVKPLVVAVGGTLIAMLVHPFLWETLLSPLRLYQLEYPTLRQYANLDVPFLHELYPLWSEEFWTRMNYFNAAGLLLWLMTLVTLVLNRERLRLSHLGAFLTATGISLAGGGEFAVTGIVNAALATVNAQQWYQANFRQSYSVETSELLFSRAGRALTVIAFFALGFVMVSGHLTGAQGRRVGLGLDPQLEQTIASYEQVLDDSFDDRPFVFRLFQGDVLNWLDKQPFIDSRVRLFAAGPSSLVEEHLQLRPALLVSEDESVAEENRTLWQSAFDKYDISHVLPRLSGSLPDYTTVRNLSRSPDWTLTKLGAATAVFYRTDSASAELQAYVVEHDSSNLVKTTLGNRQEQTESPDQRVVWPRPPTVYERYLYLPNRVTPNELLEARHYSLLVRQGVVETTRENLIAAAYAAIRKTHAGLAEDPNDLTAYHVLGECYELLRGAEHSSMEDADSAPTESMRNFQAISAYNHALLCDPDDVLAHYRLFQAFNREQRQDLALHHLQRIQEILGQLTLYPPTDPDFEADRESKNELFLMLTADLAELRRGLDEQLDAGEDRIQLVQQLVTTGYLLTALETIEEDLTVISGDPRLTFIYGQLLLQVGRSEEAHDQLQRLKTFSEMGVLNDWHTIASLSYIAAEDLPGALATMEEEHRQLELSASVLLMRSHPMQATGPNGPRDDHHQSDPLLTVSRRVRSSGVYFTELLPRIEDNELRQALVHLELGNNGAAERLFRRLLQRDPATGLRPLVELYLPLLTDDPEIPPAPEEVTENLVPDLYDEEKPDDAPTGEASKAKEPVEKDDVPPADSTESPADTKDPVAEEKPASP